MTVHILSQLTGETCIVFGGCDGPRAGCVSSGVWGAVCQGFYAPSEACGVLGLLLGGIFFAVASSSPLYGNKWDLEYSCRQLISEQEVSWSTRLGEFNKCFFAGRQSKLLFKLLLVITFLLLNRP